MREALKTRTVIIGNSGSGKSTLAVSLAALADVPAIDLDLLHWEGDGYGVKREAAVARRMAVEAAANARWVIEGVYGWLAEVTMPRATALIWLDLPWNICRERLLARGVRGGGTEADLAELLAWAQAYQERQTSSSLAGHARLFGMFAGPKLRLGGRDDADQLIADLRSQDAKRAPT